jgi:hypothetical protein
MGAITVVNRIWDGATQGERGQYFLTKEAPTELPEPLLLGPVYVVDPRI